MALKLRKDIKKSSYYVWFLGAKESKGLRGADYISPVIKHLEEREKDVEPFKVTLQVSHKGLKIVQNIVSHGAKNSKPKNETIKHFIPHNTVTYCYQEEDIIACILLLFNPVTKCPLHVHAYRCDSIETATLLKSQLQVLIERPENQKKIAEIESRLKPQKETKKLESSVGSDTGASTRESEDSEERFALENSRIASLYDSVAAELRAKLNKKNSPILLPPRDYDTVHRQKGNLTGIELRRCLNANIVGQNVKTGRLESSGGSSGIGSDHPPSPESPETPDASRFHTLETQHSTSEDDDWNQNTPVDSALYFTDSRPVALPRSTRNNPTSNHIDRDEKAETNPHRFSRYAHKDLKFSKSLDNDNYGKINKVPENITKYLEKPISKYSSNKFLERTKSNEYKKKDDSLLKSKFLSKSREVISNNDFERYIENRDRQLSVGQERNPEKDIKLSREFLKKELNRKLNERFFGEEKDSRYNRETKESREKQYFEDDGFIEDNTRYRHRSADFELKNPVRDFSYEDEDVFFEESSHRRNPPMPKIRQKHTNSEGKLVNKPFERNSYARPNSPLQSLERNKKYYDKSNNRELSSGRYRDREVDEERHIKHKSDPNDPRYYEPNDTNRSPSKNSLRNNRDISRTSSREERLPPERYFDNSDNTIHRKNPLFRQRTPSPDEIIAPEARFRDAKEKFLSMEKERLDAERRRPEPPIAPTIQPKGFLKRNQSMVAYAPKENNLRKSHDERYYNDRDVARDTEYNVRPKPAPRQASEGVRYRERDDGYRNTDRFDPKRRSMFSLIEEERRKNSSDIAKELKRRSYLDVGNHFDNFERHERSSRARNISPELERYSNSPDMKHSKSIHNIDKLDSEISQSPSFDLKFVKNPQKLIKNAPAGYRHSFVEPKMRDNFENKNNFSDFFLQRANSSVSNMQARVGIASVHPY